MAITECANHHVYDSDRYAVCPYCNGGGNVINFDEIRGGGMTAAPAGFGGYGGMPSGGDGRTVAPSNFGRPQPDANFGKTVAPSGYGRAPAQPSPMPSPAPVRSSFASEPSKTVAPESIRRRMEEENKTVAVFKKRYDLDPVVGWLVCLDGSEAGRDYRILSRINSIGRGENMDICLRNDMTISKENHARLAYDSKHNDFRLIPGTSINNIYINEEPIYVPTKLAAYDVIELGDSRYLFLPLCSDRFDWTSGLKKE